MRMAASMTDAVRQRRPGIVSVCEAVSSGRWSAGRRAMWRRGRGKLQAMIDVTIDELANLLLAGRNGARRPLVLPRLLRKAREGALSDFTEAPTFGKIADYSFLDENARGVGGTCRA